MDECKKRPSVWTIVAKEGKGRREMKHTHTHREREREREIAILQWPKSWRVLSLNTVVT